MGEHYKRGLFEGFVIIFSGDVYCRDVYQGEAFLRVGEGR